METDDLSFAGLLARVRGGDADGARLLIELYEPHVRRVVRARLADRSIRRAADSLDICQSVFGAFFVRAALGEFDLDSANDLVRLLTRMARNRVQKLVEREQAARRDVRRLDPRPLECLSLEGTDETPSQLAAHAELLEWALARLTEEERFLAEQRAAGRPWAKLAGELKAEPDALRMRWKRALDRVSQELGFADAGTS